MSPEEQRAWEEVQLNVTIDLEQCHIDPAPFQLIGHTSLLKVHTLFSMLQLNHTYVTSIGRLVGIVSTSDLRKAIERMNAGTLLPKLRPNLAAYQQSFSSDQDSRTDDSELIVIQEGSIETPRASDRLSSASITTTVSP